MSLWINSLIIDIHLVHNISLILLRLLLEVDLELIAVLIMNVCAKGPNDRESNIVVYDFVCVDVFIVKFDGFNVEEDLNKA